MKEADKEWLQGRTTLGTATKWTPEEIRLVAELGFGLAEQGRVSEAIVLFEGLAALAPATIYFQAALGALWLRESEPQKALPYLNYVLQNDSKDIMTLVNRGETLMLLGDREAAKKDFQTALNITGGANSKKAFDQSNEGKSLIRARALLMSLERQH